jgi:hypothetical protein
MCVLMPAVSSCSLRISDDPPNYPSLEFAATSQLNGIAVSAEPSAFCGV